MLAVMVLESCKVSFETIGRRRNSGIVEVMKHMWQGFEQHAAGAYEIADHPAAFWDLRQFEAVATFPGTNGRNEGVSLNGGTNRCDSEEYFPQTLGVRARWIPTAPHQTLALNMHQAALDDDRRPQSPKYSDGLWVAVESTADRSQPIDLKRLEERRELPLRVFVYSILTADYLAQSSVHDRDEAATLIQESSIEDQVVGKVCLGWLWWSVEPMVYDTLQCRRAEPTDRPKLSHVESLGQPSLEPCTPVVKAFVDSLPVERPATFETPPSLPAIDVMTVPFDALAATPWTMFFSGSCLDYETASIMGSTSH